MASPYVLRFSIPGFVGATWEVWPPRFPSFDVSQPTAKRALKANVASATDPHRNLIDDTSIQKESETGDLPTSVPGHPPEVALDPTDRPRPDADPLPISDSESRENAGGPTHGDRPARVPRYTLRDRRRMPRCERSLVPVLDK
jgi:hypothetical protein